MKMKAEEESMASLQSMANAANWDNGQDGYGQKQLDAALQSSRG